MHSSVELSRSAKAVAAVHSGDVPELERLLGTGGAAHPNEKRGRV